MTGEVTGLIHTALALASSTAMSQFREAVAEVIGHRLVLLPGRATAAAIQHKQLVLQQFMDDAPDMSAKHLMLMAVLNGDWRVTTHVQFHTGDVIQVENQEPSQVLALVVQVVLQSVCSGQPSTWPRHRWVGAKRSVNELGILMFLHGLLFPAFKAFVEKIDGKKTTCAKGSVFDGANVDDQAMAEADMSVTDDFWELLDEEPGTGSGGGGVPETHPTPAAGALDYHLLHSRDRKLASQWLDTNPLSRVGLIRVTMMPLCEYVSQQLDLGSAGWEKRQVLSAAASEGDTSLLDREYPITVASSESLDTAYSLAIKDLMHNPTLWKTLPRSCWDATFVSLAFRVIARQAAAVFQLVTLGHQNYPVALFQLIKKPHLYAHMCSLPGCVVGPFCSSLLGKFKAMSEQEMRMLLALHAMLQKTDISAVEATHASIRRDLATHSVQVNALSLQDASAHFMFQQLRRGHWKQLYCLHGRLGEKQVLISLLHQKPKPLSTFCPTSLVGEDGETFRSVSYTERVLQVRVLSGNP